VFCTTSLILLAHIQTRRAPVPAVGAAALVCQPSGAGRLPAARTARCTGNVMAVWVAVGGVVTATHPAVRALPHRPSVVAPRCTPAYPVKHNGGGSHAGKAVRGVHARHAAVRLSVRAVCAVGVLPISLVCRRVAEEAGGARVRVVVVVPHADVHVDGAAGRACTRAAGDTDVLESRYLLLIRAAGVAGVMAKWHHRHTAVVRNRGAELLHLKLQVGAAAAERNGVVLLDVLRA
jgi:hypothetical protein